MNVNIRVLTPDDAKFFPEIHDLLNRTQGVGLFSSEYMNKITSKKEAAAYAAFIEDRLVGIGVVQIIDDISYHLPFDPDLPLKLKGKKIGSFTSLAVVESLQGKGIGQQISKKRLEWLKTQNCDVALGTSWVSGLKNSSDRVFEKMGFTAGLKIDQFFREYSIEKPFDCPGCKTALCKCAAIFYIKYL